MLFESFPTSTYQQGDTVEAWYARDGYYYPATLLRINWESTISLQSKEPPEIHVKFSIALLSFQLQRSPPDGISHLNLQLLRCSSGASEFLIRNIA